MSDEIGHLKKGAMLAALAETGNITQAAKAAKIARSMHYLWLEEDPAYASGVERAMAQAADLLEEEARRRAMTGVLEPVFYQGKKVGTVRRYSDSLLIFLLKGAKPEKYQERVKHNFGDISNEELIRRGQGIIARIAAAGAGPDAGGGAPAAPDNGDGADRGGDSE